MLELPFITTCYQLPISGLAQAWDSPTCYFYIAYCVFYSYLVCHQSLASVRYIFVVETLRITLVSLFYTFVFNKFLCLFQKKYKKEKRRKKEGWVQATSVGWGLIFCITLWMLLGYIPGPYHKVIMFMPNRFRMSRIGFSFKSSDSTNFFVL